MKYQILIILIFLLQFNLFSQEFDAERKISDFFFQFNLNQHPKDQIIKSKLRFVHESSYKVHSYQYNFEKHPIFQSLKEGAFRIIYRESDIELGIFEFVLLLDFENDSNAKKMQDSLSLELDGYGEKIEIGQALNCDDLILQKWINYQKLKEYHIPNLSIHFFSKSISEKHSRIIIRFTGTSKIEEFKKYIDRFNQN